MASRYEDVPRNAHSESMPTLTDSMVFDMERSRGVWLYESSQQRDYLDLTGSFQRLELGYNHRSFRALRTQVSEKVQEQQLESLRERLLASCRGPYKVWLGASLDEVYEWTVCRALNQGAAGARIVELRWEDTADSEVLAQSCADELEWTAPLALEEAFREDEEPVAGLWVELPSVAQPMLPELQRWLGELEKLCREQGALLILDEVNSGFGRSGLWWDWLHFELSPDLVIFGGKGKVSGVFSHARVAISAEDGMGAPKASQVASSESLLDVIEEEGLLGHADVMGRYLIKVLEDLQSTFHQIEAVSSRGLRASFRLPSEADRDRLLAACLDENLILLALGERSVGFYPPLDVRPDAIGRAAAQLEVALQAVYEGQP
ncbi:MAG: aminotransferase class III-fold pyridoxal phosphate-dependent enzyme [Myxococcota bacterium]|nr:aminotransferase class III-fold pyridoxal phosphate-dependent enzyme [Myxococcota bacterium]